MSGPAPGSGPAGPGDRDSLLSAARDVARLAYAPYSGFRVGASVLADDGRVFVGCNVENASYGLCLCAERNALSTAMAAGARRFVAIAVACLDAPPTLGAAGRSPCGACRQWMLELAPDAVVHLDGVDQVFPVRELLPMGFVLETSRDAAGVTSGSCPGNTPG